MKPSVSYALRVGLALAASAAIVGAWSVTPAGSNDRDLAVASVEIRGPSVQVVVVNAGTTPRKASLAVRVTLASGTQTTASTVVTVFGRQKAFVVLNLPSSIQDVISAEMIVDDPAPF